jgi:uncharacterized alpha-E superfamily protein
MLSRIADSLFWLNRYMERSDCLLRVIRTNYILSFDADNSSDFSWDEVIRLLAHAADGHLPENINQEGPALKYLITNTKNLNSIKVLFTKARENARGVQDNITKEVWEQVNRLYHIVNEPGLEKKITGSRSLEIIDQLAENCVLYYGVTDSTMPRGQGWNFMNLGKFIERCLLTIDIADVHFAKINYKIEDAQHILFWRNLLLSLSGYELYLKNYTRGLHNINIMDHVIFNPDFPRSLIYSLNRLKKYLKDVVDDTRIEGSDSLEKSFGRIWSKVEFTDSAMVQEQGLEKFFDTIRHDLIEFSQHLTRIYFSYA